MHIGHVAIRLRKQCESETSEVDVTLDVVPGFSREAEARIAECLGEVGSDLMKEAGRLELERRDKTVKRAAVTESDVVKAYRRLREGNVVSRRSPLDIFLQVASTGTGIAAGALATLLHSPWEYIAFGANAATAALLTIIVALRSR